MLVPRNETNLLGKSNAEQIFWEGTCSMTPRTGLFVALIGLVIAVVCASPLYFIGGLDPDNDNAVMGIILLALGAMLGGTVLLVGLILAAATALRGKHRRPS
jgi:hypothetical protein